MVRILAVVAAVLCLGAARRDEVKITFRTDPSGAEVHPEGRATSRCTTPCDVIVDPDDGDDPKERTFVLTREGYIDHPVEVSLREGDQLVHVTLVRGTGKRR